MYQFSKEELLFVEDLPKHVEIECPVCLDILTDPHQVTCCGHNFCGSCIERVRASNGSCPMCNEKEYQSFIDKKYSRIITGLEVYCSNKKKGCQWKGELKNMSTHLNKEKREGECQYEEVKCRYEKCQERKQRRYLEDHEDSECYQRPFECQYCGKEGTFLSITEDHYEECRQYPVTCPNKCSSNYMPKDWLNNHVKSDCPLEPVNCVFSWAGCNDKPLRKDVHVHTADTKHMTLLAVACGQLKKENEQIKEENIQIKGEIEKLKNAPIASLLPVDIKKGSEAVHLYTGACGQHMSARIVTHGSQWDECCFILFAFHKGQFDKSLPKLPKIFGKLTYKPKVWALFFSGSNSKAPEDTNIPLIVDTEATYKQLPHNILDTIRSTTYIHVPHGVIKIELPRHRNFTIDSATIYAK